MKVLFLSTKSPLPTNDGHSLRTYNLLKQAARKHDITLVTFVKYQDEYNYRKELEQICSRVCFLDIPENKSRVRLYLSLFLTVFSSKPFLAGKYFSRPMNRLICTLIEEISFDVVHLDTLPLCVYLKSLKGIQTVLNEHNVESSLLSRHLEVIKNPLTKLFYTQQQKRLEQFEKLTARAVDHIITCSENDKRDLEIMASSKPITVVPNGVDIKYFSPAEKSQNDLTDLVFVGGMNWFPNYDAMLWFTKDVMPILLKKHPGLHLHIIGKKNGKTLSVKSDHVTYHGFVDDIQPLVHESAVFISPLRVGGGTRLKLLDAMAMGKAIVSTTIGAEGLNVKDGEQMLLADTPESFAEAISSLLDSPTRREQLEKAARIYVERHFSWDIIGRSLLQVYEQVAAGQPSQ